MNIKDRLLYVGIYVGALGLAPFAESISKGHGKDVLFCYTSYCAVQAFGCNMTPLQSAIIAFSVQGLGEICQQYHLFPGTFDWKDFIAYGIGSSLVFGTETLIRHCKNKKSKELSDVVDAQA